MRLRCRRRRRQSKIQTRWETPLGAVRIVRRIDNLQGTLTTGENGVQEWGMQRSWNSAMKYAKATPGSQHRTGRLTTRTFVRAACFVTLLVCAVLSIELLVIAVHYWEITPLVVLVVALPIMAIVFWMIAAVLGTVCLLPRWLWAKAMDQVVRTRRWTGARSGVWDDWLDGSSRV
jgi:hypothetical protein